MVAHCYVKFLCSLNIDDIGQLITDLTLCGYDHHRSYLLLIYFLQSSCLATIIILFSYLIPAQNFVAKNRKVEATATGQVTVMILILQKTQIVTIGRSTWSSSKYVLCGWLLTQNLATFPKSAFGR